MVTAAEAFERYTLALNENRLIQSAWHKQDSDGRQLACALGVIDDRLSSTSDCPASVMPRWLAQMVPWFFDNQEPADAFDWGKRFYAALAKLDGKVPFEVVYDWHAETVCPLAIEAAEKLGRKTEPHKALQELHRRAKLGDRADRVVWHATLKDAYAYADVYANAYANADVYADAYANANANANANAYADAYADAYANADAYRKSMKRLADGMVDALDRASAPDGGVTISDDSESDPVGVKPPPPQESE